VPLTAKPIRTGPDWDHPAFRAACRDLSDADRAFLDEYDSSDEFDAAKSKLAAWPRHRLGGHAHSIQEPVELDVAQAQLGVRAPYDNDRTLRAVEEAQRWTLLAQIDSDDDAGMRWGDVGTLYWLIRPEDLASGNFEASLFTSQCT
jgi:uncharacterized protein YwqG